jgi:hypothetical protein
MSVAANESALINGLLECHSKGNSYTEALNNLDGILTARARTHRECSASADSNTTSKSVVSGNGKTGFASTVTRATAEMSREESMVIQRRYLVMANELEARIKEGDKGSFSDTPAPSSPVVPVKVQSDIRSPEIKGTDQTPKVKLTFGEIDHSSKVEPVIPAGEGPSGPRPDPQWGIYLFPAYVLKEFII